MWTDEPTGRFWGKEMEGRFEEFLAFKARMSELAPGRPVFVNDVPWITAPATQWWVRWNTEGDISCHDNYPIMNRKFRARTLGNEESKTGIPDSVNLAVAVNQEAKPVWLIVGAFRERGYSRFPFRMPTPMQLRAQVYAAIIHGATGIIYFTWDTYVSRDGNIVGMSPDPQVAYSTGGPGRTKPSRPKPMDLVASRALWDAAARINAELAELVPSILSPTVGIETEYSLTTRGAPVTDMPIRCLLKHHPDGGYTLLSVNLDDANLVTTFEFPAGIESVQPLFEHREALAIDEGIRFEDRFEPFDTHVYRVTPKANSATQEGNGRD
jgi:hypothetical protein